MPEHLARSTTDPCVAIVILNWNGWSDTIECLESIRRIRYGNFIVVVVDNGSTDDSVKRIEEYTASFLAQYSERVTASVNSESYLVSEYTKDNTEASEDLEAFSNKNHSARELIIIKSQENLGFAEGNNLGIRFALECRTPEYLMLLNNDTVVDVVFLRELVENAKDYGGPIVLGSKILHFDIGGRTNTVRFAGGGINWWLYPGYHPLHEGAENEKLSSLHGVKDCEWVSGAAMMASADLFKGDLLDKNFFFGCEDVDFCLRQRRKGGRIAICLDSVIWHKVGASRKKSRNNMRSMLADILSNFKLVKRYNRIWIVYVLVHMTTLALTFCANHAGDATRPNGLTDRSRGLLRFR